MEVHDSAVRVGNTDAAALVAGGVAIVLTTYLDEGEYDPVGFIVAVTLACTLLAYLLGEYKSPAQRVAFAGVIGLTAVPAFGFLFELLMKWDAAHFFQWSEVQRTIESAEKVDVVSAVGSVPILLAWLGSAAAAGLWDLQVWRKRNPLPPPAKSED